MMQPWLDEHQYLLSRQFAQQNLPHAILISGVNGSGKRLLSHWLIQLLACQQPQSKAFAGKEQILQACGQCKTCLLYKSNTLPDHLNLKADKNSLGIDEIRYASQFLQKKPQLGTYKTVLIEQSGLLTVAASNALLKTLEEPTDNSIVVLLTNDLERLLPTIISRVRVLPIRPEVGNALIQQLGSRVNNNQYDNFVNLTQLPELTDQEIYNQYQHFKSTFLNYLYYRKGEGLLVEQVVSNAHALRWLEKIIVDLQRQQLLVDSGVTLNHPPISNTALNQITQIVINGGKMLKVYIQANKSWVCEKLVMDIAAVLEQNNLSVKQESNQESKFDPH